MGLDYVYKDDADTEPSFPENTLRERIRALEVKYERVAERLSKTQILCTEYQDIIDNITQRADF